MRRNTSTRARPTPGVAQTPVHLGQRLVGIAGHEQRELGLGPDRRARLELDGEALRPAFGAEVDVEAQVRRRQRRDLPVLRLLQHTTVAEPDGRHDAAAVGSDVQSALALRGRPGAAPARARARDDLGARRERQADALDQLVARLDPMPIAEEGGHRRGLVGD